MCIQKACDVEIVDSFRFYGVLVDSHLTFKHHVQDMTKKAKKRIYLLIKLKRTGSKHGKRGRGQAWSGGGRRRGKLFYLSNVRSVMMYAAQSFYSMHAERETSRNTESIQKLSPKIICPDIERYSEHLNILKIPVLGNFIKYVVNILTKFVTVTQYYKILFPNVGRKVT